jgi:hypothetical protein
MFKEHYMKKTLITILIGTVLTFGLMLGQTLAETPQSKWVADVPIMPTLTIEPGLGFAFANPDGRIVRIYLNGDEDQSEVIAYYAQALEPLGWTRIGENRWNRETEILQISRITAASTELWEITIRPE